MAHDLIRQMYEETPATTPSTLPCWPVRYLLHLILLNMVMNRNQVARGGILIFCWKSFPFELSKHLKPNEQSRAW
jgi:hypothetical protein